MDILLKKKLESDFESYMFEFYRTFKRFNLQDFGSFATTLLNYYVNNKVVPIGQKKEAAYFLISLYNKGIGNRISEEHLQEIAQTIEADYSIEYTVMQRLL